MSVWSREKQGRNGVVVVDYIATGMVASYTQGADKTCREGFLNPFMPVWNSYGRLYSNVNGLFIHSKGRYDMARVISETFHARSGVGKIIGERDR